MDTDKHRSELNKITESIIGCAYKVGNTLGYGFLEKVYENALAYELKKEGHEVRQQYSFDVRYEEQVVGQYLADILVDNLILVELKTSKSFDSSHVAQCINYLKATGSEICLLINFSKTKVDVKRIVL